MRFASLALVPTADRIRRRAAARPRERVGPDAASAVPDLIERLADDDESVRDAARWALVRVGDAVFPSPAKAMRADDPLTRASAAWVLGEWGSEVTPLADPDAPC